MPVGNYTVHVNYYGDGNYTVAENDTTFTVSKLNATVSIDVDDINYTETAVITVSVPAGVGGNITIRLNDTAKTNMTANIVDGKAVFEIPDLAAGNYTFNVTYNGNDDYNINLESVLERLEKGLPYKKNTRYFNKNTSKFEVELINSIQ